MPAVAKQDPVDTEIGERLHSWMWRSRVPQTELAALLGISQQSLGRKLRGDSAWSAGELRRAGLLLSVSVGWFFGETEEVPVRPKGLEPPTFWSGVWCDDVLRCRRCGHLISIIYDRWVICRDSVEHIRCHERESIRTDDLALAA